MIEIKKKNNLKIVNFVNRIYYFLKVMIVDVIKYNENILCFNLMLY